MPNPELSQRIRALPEELLGLEREPGTAECLRRIDALKGRARALEPLDGVEEMALSDYDRDWLVRYTYNSNAIEGSTLTLEDTSLVLEGEFVPSDSPARYVFAARGVADGMAYVREYAEEGRKLDEELVRRVHEVTALDLQPFARGTFRPYGYLARTTATRVKTADPLEIRDDLRSLIDGWMAAQRIRCSGPPVSTRCSRTSIRSWMAMGGPAASCSTSCCYGTDTVPQPSNTMRVGHTRAAWRHGRWTASRIRSAPFS